VLSAPNEQPTVIEQVQKNIASIQQQATAAVSDLNAKVLAATGTKSNQQLLNTVQTQAQTYATQVKGKKISKTFTALMTHNMLSSKRSH
jgi:hypothetical protein